VPQSPLTSRHLNSLPTSPAYEAASVKGEASTGLGVTATDMVGERAAIAQLREQLLTKTDELAQLRGHKHASQELLQAVTSRAEARVQEMQDRYTASIKDLQEKHGKERKKQKEAFERLSSALEESSKNRHKWKKKYTDEKAESDKLQHVAGQLAESRAALAAAEDAARALKASNTQLEQQLAATQRVAQQERAQLTGRLC
jgi:chromosome segregation ATPase